MQSLKVLVNLSLNPDMVPHLLAAKVSASVLPESNTFVKWHVLSVVTNMRKFLKSEECLLLPAYEVFGMVMFSVVTVCLFTLGGWVPIWHVNPQTCSNLFIWGHPRDLLISGRLTFDWNAFLLLDCFSVRKNLADLVLKND